MDSLVIFELMSASVVLVALCYGAWSDVHTRTAPKWIWTVCSPFAAVTTLLWYGAMVYWNGLTAILSTFLVSLILSLFCFVMAHRMGNGGDWRALYHISILTPWFAPLTLILACVCGFVQVCIDHLRKSPIKSAWMVSITIGFVLSVIAKVFIL